MGAKPYLLIPCFDGYSEAKEDLHNILKSVEIGEYTKNFRILVLLDSCHRIFEKEFSNSYPWAGFLNHTNNPLNFCANVNRGLRLALEDKVGAWIINQDTILPHSRFLMAPNNLMYSCKTQEFPDKSLEEVVSLLNGLVNQEDPIVPVSELPGHKVPGYAFWLGSEVLQKVGILDETSFKGSFEDDDITVRAILAGFKVFQIPIYVQHIGSHIDQAQKGLSRSGAYGIADNSLGLHLEKFYMKWSIPREIEHSNAIKWILENFEWSEEMRCE